ncbi:hypothetical protein G6F52_005434 [Rhizopus delemar]|nr:hypothetical protein G6F52_005434 [Rhizopus delemar]
MYAFLSQKIELLDQNVTGQLNETELGEWAMKKFNLDQSLVQQTISNIFNNAETLYSNNNVVNNGKSIKTTRYPQLDDEVVKFVVDMNNNNLPVNRYSFLRYNELRKIEELLGPCDPADVMNADETGLCYQSPPRRTICFESLDDLKKSKICLTVGLLCNSDGAYKGHPVVIGQHKSPKCFKARANLLSMTAIGKKHEIEYHYSTNAWMTTYVKKLNVAFGRQNQKIALLLDNAFIHKIRIPLNSIKLIFLLENTTSKLQTLDAGSLLFVGIIDNFKAHFRAQQYDRALCLYINKKLDNPNIYKMNQAQAMFFLANAWLKVKSETTKGMLPDLPKNFDNKVTDVSQLNLEAVESEMIVCYTCTINNEEAAEGNVDETEENDNTEQDEQFVDTVECKKRLKEAYETILMYEVPLDDLDRKLHRRIRMRLAGFCAELNKSKE